MIYVSTRMKFKGEDMLSEKSKYLQNVWAFILTVKISHKIITIFMPCEQCTYLVCCLNYQIRFYVGST